MKQPITNESGERDGRKDFDFLLGSWKIQHRRLKERLKECTEWEEFEGRHIFNRFIWNVDSSDSCRWEQAFSAGGKTWETNWTMKFTRQG